MVSGAREVSPGGLRAGKCEWSRNGPLTAFGAFEASCRGCIVGPHDDAPAMRSDGAAPRSGERCRGGLPEALREDSRAPKLRVIERERRATPPRARPREGCVMFDYSLTKIPN